MRTIQIILSATITLLLTYFLNTQIVVSGQGIPPLGKFLSPFQGFWQNAENEAITAPEELKIEGLKEPVEVFFDHLLIPHIYAKNDHDLYMAQGYITAFHRLWQMEFQLYSTSGRISELLGEKALDYDRVKRRSGMVEAAEQSTELLRKEEPELYAILEAYAKGVNAYINSLSYAEYPIEYKLLDYAPEEWTPFKTHLLLKEMSDQLSRGERDLEHTNALRIWGNDLFNMLYPETHPNLDPVIPKGTKWNFSPLQVEKPVNGYPLIKTTGSLEKPDPQIGSNSFVVNGNKTANGAVLLANEPDLGLNLPSIWYVAHLNAPGINVMGSTIPGAPGVILGFNDKVAWGFTNAKRDLVDWYAIDFKDEKREEYRYNNQWMKTQKKIEEIKIRGGETFYDTVIYTHFGPVTYDASFNVKSERINLAMRWTAHDPSLDVKALYLMNRAKNYEDYVEAFSYYTGPPQNMSFASVEGDIAIWINGKFPVKWEGQGKFVLDGSNPLHEWQKWMPREHLLHVKNPPQNFVSSANQHPVDSTYPYYDYDYNFEYYRNRRINDRIRTMTNIKPEDMMKLQNDNYNYRASESLPMMLAALDSTQLTGARLNYYEPLAMWDYFNEPERTEPTLYELWWDLLYHMTWDEFRDREESLYTPSVYNTIYLLATQPEFAFFDRKETNEKETAGDLFRASFDMAVDSLEKWKKENGDDIAWYKYKNTTVQHLMRLDAFSKKQVPIGGNENIVNAASGRHGPSWRMIVELGKDGVKAWGIYPGGQSGNPGNPTYSSLLDRWASGKYEPMLFQNTVKGDQKIVFTQTLMPR